MRTDGIGIYAFAIIVVILFAGIITAMVLFPNGLPGNSQKTITVRASGTSYGYPEEGIVYLSVNGTGLTPEIATSNLSLSLAKLNYTLSKYANSSSIKTTYYSLSKVYNSTMYTAVEGIEVDTSAANVSPVLGAVASVKGILVLSASAKLSNAQTSQLINQALASAMQNATSQAELLAGTNSVTAVNISSYSYYIYPVYSTGVFSGAAAPGAQNPAFFTGTQSVNEQINVVFRSG